MKTYKVRVEVGMILEIEAYAENMAKAVDDAKDIAVGQIDMWDETCNDAMRIKNYACHVHDCEEVD